MLAVALPETFLCWRLSQRACKPSVSTVFTGDATHVYVVALADELTAGEEQGCLLTGEGEGLTKVVSATQKLQGHQLFDPILLSVGFRHILHQRLASTTYNWKPQN